MKCLLLVLLAVVFAVACIPAQVIDHMHVAATGDLEWFVPPEAFAADDVVTYELFRYVPDPGNPVDDQDPENLVPLGIVMEPTFSYDISGEADALYVFGVRTVVVRVGIVSTTPISWCYDPEAADTEQGTFMITQSGAISLDKTRGFRVR